MFKKMFGGKKSMILDKAVRLTISVFALSVLFFSFPTQKSVSAASLKCEYDKENPSLEHAVKGFMDPALFGCAEQELRDVLARTEPCDGEALAATHFLLAGALFGQQLSADIPDSIITEHLIKGFLIMPEWSGSWYFNDMPEFMDLIPPAQSQAKALLECPYDKAQPSLEHAKRVMYRFNLYECAAAEVSAVMPNLEAADSTDSNTIAEAYFLLGQADFGLNLKYPANIIDSTIVDNLTQGFVYSWEYSDDWLFGDSDDFAGLLSLARIRAEEIRNVDDRAFYKKPIYILGGVGAAMAGVITAILISGDDETDPVADTIPSFPEPPGE
jgi:hypothetical protein